MSIEADPKMRRKDKDLLLTWLAGCRAKLRETASDLLSRVRSLVLSHESRTASMVKIKEGIKPSMMALMRRLKENTHRTNRRTERDMDENVR